MIDLGTIIVKVGNQSHTAFSTRTRRAITVVDMHRLYEQGSHVAVIEHIYDDEQTEVKQFIQQFIGDGKHKVYFYVPDNDEITCGIADELELDIYMNINDVYKDIHRTFGVNVNPSMELRQQLASQEDEGLFDKTDQGTSDVNIIESVRQSDEAEVTVKAGEFDDVSSGETVLKFDDAKLSEELGFDITSISVGEERVDKSTLEKETEHTVKDDNESGKDNAKTEAVKQKKTVSKKDTKQKEGTAQKADSETREVGRETDVSAEISARITRNELYTADEYNKLKASLAKAILSIKNQQDALSKKENLIEVLQSEAGDMRANYERFLKSDRVLEEPINMSEYRELLSQIEEIKSKHSKLEGERDTLAEQLTDVRERLEKSREEVNEYKESIDTLEAEKTGLEERIRNGDVSSGDLIDAQNAANELRIELNRLKSSYENAQNSLDENEKEFRKLNRRIELEFRTRVVTMEMFNTSLTELSLTDAKLVEAEAEKEELSLLVTQLREELEAVSAEIVRLRDVEKSGIAVSSKAEMLESQLDENRKQMERLQEAEQTAIRLQAELDSAMTKAGGYEVEIERLKESEQMGIRLQTEFNNLSAKANDYETEIERLKKIETDSVSLRARSETLARQLSEKEQQYNDLLKNTSMDSNGAAKLAEINSSLERVNREMKEQLDTSKRGLASVTKERNTAFSELAVLREQNASLNERVSKLSGGAAGDGSIKPIKYAAGARIIPVFGCGSYGITTMSVSIAQRLSGSARVVVVDFDLANPKMDVWFKVSPMVKIAGLAGGSNSALSIFFDKQLEYFSQNEAKLIKSPVKLKNGCIDYIGGIYGSVDAVKIMTADYSKFIEYLGNMYDYIVIDFGRFGASGIINKIVKYFVDISYKAIAISTQDKYDIRNFKMKMNACSIDTSKVYWILNMCTQTKLDDTAKQYLSNIEYNMMPYDNDVFGKRIEFGKASKLSRDKLDMIIASSGIR